MYHRSKASYGNNLNKYLTAFRVTGSYWKANKEIPKLSKQLSSNKAIEQLEKEVRTSTSCRDFYFVHKMKELHRNIRKQRLTGSEDIEDNWKVDRKKRSKKSLPHNNIS